jgi:hypothetical protein
MSKISELCAVHVHVADITGHDRWQMDALSIVAASVATPIVAPGFLHA